MTSHENGIQQLEVTPGEIIYRDTLNNGIHEKYDRYGDNNSETK